MKIIHNKFTKVPKVTDNLTKINYEHELTTLEKYVEITAELSSVENYKDLAVAWLLYSASLLGIIFFSKLILSFVEHEESFMLETTVMLYSCLCILAFAAKDYLYLMLVFNVTQSNLNMKEKLSKIEQHHLVSGHYLTLTKCVIFILITLLLLSFAAYFTLYIPHPLLTSLFIYLSLLTVVNIVRKNVNFGYHVAFAVLSTLLCAYNLFIQAELRYEQQYEEDEAQTQAEIDNEQSISEVIDKHMNDYMEEKEKERERIQELVYKPATTEQIKK